ncbi:DUF1294 domain-containing protein [Roseovarius spongiae]|uniref:DUF1294 domain-containing protein n=1 Tax=Roseovarius spongiae TaxID=2320272 RepID=A0A3A8AWY8_9RHOB|nr:DUF1294 domain-containing protein [Roseovarius spongiae]RKF14204.1 DUF1294 domain-containing protein [Roseovarius spongiae]
MVNAVTFTAFRLDKNRARTQEWRIPEKTLLTMAMVGGWPAAKLAQRVLRHKTRKQPFARTLNIIGLAWLWVFGLFIAAAILTAG